MSEEAWIFERAPAKIDLLCADHTSDSDWSEILFLPRLPALLVFDRMLVYDRRQIGWAVYVNRTRVSSIKIE